MPNLINSAVFDRVWIDDTSDEIEHIPIDWLSSSVPLGFSWGPNGYGDPFEGFWRDRHGRETEIKTMDNSYVCNCLKFLENKFGKQEVQSWKIYKNLLTEATARGIDGRSEWDS